ncbi:MAG: immune inhibitor A, partial [Candidatus Eiseniibacteriota bacterium]
MRIGRPFCRSLVCACLLFIPLCLTPGFVSSAPLGPVAAQERVGTPTPQFAPGYPGKKGLTHIHERRGLEPKLLLRDRDVFAVTSFPAFAETTTLKVLVLLVDFPDFPFMHERLFVERHLLFLSQFYSVASGGRLQLQITPTDSVFTLPQEMWRYGRDDDIGLRLVELSQDAVATADSLTDFALYDEVVLLHAGLGQEADVFGNSPEQIWSATLGPTEFEYYLPDSLPYPAIATNDTLPGGATRYIDRIAIVPEDETQDTFVFSPLGVYAHEFGHLLGLPDLYDTTPPGGADSQGIGNWGLMGTGLWNAYGYSPAEPGAWSKAVMGWAPVRVVSRPDTLELPFSSGLNEAGEILLVPIGGREYFLIENRLQDANGNLRFDFDDSNADGVLDIYEDSYDRAEFDYFLPGSGAGSGLLIWHIDEQQVEAGMPYNTVNGDRFHKGIDLEEADGIQDLDELGFTFDSYGSPLDSYRDDNNASFTPSTNPNSDGSYGGRSHVYVEDIGPPGQLMGMRIHFGMRKENWPVASAAPFETNHPNASDLDGDSVPELVACDTAGNLYVLEADGSAYLNPGVYGAPVKSLGEEVLSSPVIGDIDGDDLPEAVVVAASGRVFAWNGEDLSEVMDGDGNPGTHGVLCIVRPAGETNVLLSDLDDDGREEIVFGSSLPDTTILWPFVPRPAPSGQGVVTGAAASDSCFHFYTLRVEGDSVVTVDLIFAEPAYRAPIAFDFDGDGTRETLVPTGSGDGTGRIHFVDLCLCVVEPPAPPTCTCPALTGVETEFAEIV